MEDYYKVLRRLVELSEDESNLRTDRTGTGTYSVFGERMEFDLSVEFPILREKYTWFKGIKEELLWMLRGGDNVRPLQEVGVHIWDEWADEDGNLGPIYGAQIRRWLDRKGEPCDQIAAVIRSIRENPMSRRHIVSTWNVGDLDSMALPPCHGVVVQFYVNPVERTLDCQMYQRSADTVLGLPFNVASYALLTEIIATVCNLTPGRLVHVLGDAHLYANHVDQAKELLNRRFTTEVGLNPLIEAKPSLRGPQVLVDLADRYETTADAIQAVDALTSDDIALDGYYPLSKIPAPVAV